MNVTLIVHDITSLPMPELPAQVGSPCRQTTSLPALHLPSSHDPPPTEIKAMNARTILLAICICILVVGAAARDITVADGVNLQNTLQNKSPVMKEVVTDLKTAPATLATKDGVKDVTYKEETDFDILQWKTFSTTPIKTALKDIPYEDRAKYKAEYIAKYGNLAGKHTVVIGKDVITLDILDVAYLPDPGVVQFNVSPKVNGVEKKLHNPLKIANPPVLVQGEPDVTEKDDLILGGRAEDPQAAVLESISYTVMRLDDGKPTFGEPDPTVVVYSSSPFNETMYMVSPSRSHSSETFLQLIVGAGTSGLEYGNKSIVRVYNMSAASFYYTRNTMEFLTSGLLPAGGIIQNASINVYGFGHIDQYGITPGLSFTKYIPGNYTAPAIADYNKNLTATTRYGTDIPFASFSDTGYNTMYFGSTGISQINNTGYTAVMGRLSHDVDSVAISRGTTTTYSAFYYYLSPELGTSKDPYITYSYLRAAVANFTGSPREGSAGLLVQFDSSLCENSTPISVYNWSFGDGDYSSEQNTQHVYTAYGSYDVNLSITTSGGYSDYEKKDDYIVISSEDLSSPYVPQSTRFTVVTSSGQKETDAVVTLNVIETTLPDGVLYLKRTFGLDEDIATEMLTSSMTMTGHTGSDGSVVFNVHPCLKYWINVSSGGLEFNETVYPSETDYNLWLEYDADYTGYEGMNATLTFFEPNTSYFTLGANYEDLVSSTTSLLFYVNCSNGTPVYQTTVAPGTANTTLNKTLLNVRGEAYVWGIRADRSPNYENVSLDQGVTGKGANGVLIDLGLPTVPVNWYMWISLLLLFLITSLASKANIRFIAIILPLFGAMLMWFGWLSGAYLATVIPFCGAIGTIYYMKGSLRENYGTGGPGSLLVNIIVYLILLQLMIGFVNSMGIFHETAISTPEDNYTNAVFMEIQTGVDGFGGVNDPLQSSIAFASLGWTIIRAVLAMFSSVLAISLVLSELFPYIPLEFLAILQVGIWLLYIFFLLKLVGKAGSEVDF